VKPQTLKTTNRPDYSAKRRAFTRTELVAVLAAMALLVGIAWPVLANNRERSARLVCLSNLRSIGQALQIWDTEHEGRFPWRTPWCEGGTAQPAFVQCVEPPPSWYTGGLQHRAWFQWFCLSNELRTPKILACPSDTARLAAESWTTDPGGFLRPNSLNLAISYFIALDTYGTDPNEVIVGDRNLKAIFGFGSGCSSGLNYNGGLPSGYSGPWIDDKLHRASGNFLFIDGSVEELSGFGWYSRWSAVNGGRDNGVAHFQFPQ